MVADLGPFWGHLLCYAGVLVLVNYISDVAYLLQPFDRFRLPETFRPEDSVVYGNAKRHSGNNIIILLTCMAPAWLSGKSNTLVSINDYYEVTVQREVLEGYCPFHKKKNIFGSQNTYFGAFLSPPEC